MAHCTLIDNHALQDSDLLLLITQSSFVLPVPAGKFSQNSTIFPDQVNAEDIVYDAESVWLKISSDSRPPSLTVSNIYDLNIPLKISIANYLSLQYSKSVASSIKFNNHLAQIFNVAILNNEGSLDIPEVTEAILKDISIFIAERYTEKDELPPYLYIHLFKHVLKNSINNHNLRTALFMALYNEAFPLKTLEELRGDVPPQSLLEIFTYIPWCLFDNLALLRDKYEALGVYFLSQDYTESFKTSLMDLHVNKRYNDYAIMIFNMVLMISATANRPSDISAFGVPHILHKFVIPRSILKTVTSKQMSEYFTLCYGPTQQYMQYALSLVYILTNLHNNPNELCYSFSDYASIAANHSTKATPSDVMYNYVKCVVSQAFSSFMNYDTNTHCEGPEPKLALDDDVSDDLLESNTDEDQIPTHVVIETNEDTVENEQEISPNDKIPVVITEEIIREVIVTEKATTTVETMVDCAPLPTEETSPATVEAVISDESTPTTMHDETTTEHAEIESNVATTESNEEPDTPKNNEISNDTVIEENTTIVPSALDTDDLISIRQCAQLNHTDKVIVHDSSSTVTDNEEEANHETGE